MINIDLLLKDLKDKLSEYLYDPSYVFSWSSNRRNFIYVMKRIKDTLTDEKKRNIDHKYSIYATYSANTLKVIEHVCITEQINIGKSVRSHLELSQYGIINDDIITAYNFNDDNYNEYNSLNDDFDENDIPEFTYIRNEIGRQNLYFTKSIDTAFYNSLDPLWITMNGHYVNRFLNGKIAIEGDYDNGFKHGLWNLYHENGNYKHSCTFNRGFKNGIYRVFRNDGSRIVSITYSNGTPFGSYIEYDENNKIVVKGELSNNKKIGIWIIMSDEYGKIQESYMNGIIDTVTIINHNNHRIVYTYKNGEVISAIAIDKKNKIVESNNNPNKRIHK